MQLSGVSLAEGRVRLSEPRLEAEVPQSIPTEFASGDARLATKSYVISKESARPQFQTAGGALLSLGGSFSASSSWLGL